MSLFLMGHYSPTEKQLLKGGIHEHNRHVLEVDIHHAVKNNKGRKP